jgi:flagellar biosynthesis/type III secretory pathway chaperone
MLNDAEKLAADLREIVQQKRMLLAELDEIDRKQMDILHRIERKECRYRERSKLATELHRVRSRRRWIKDWLYANKPVLDYLESDRGANLTKWLDGFIGVARKAGR